MSNEYAVIETILATEKSMNIKDLNQYMFKVAPGASKIEIAKAVERIYSVKVASVNVVNRKGKLRRANRRSKHAGRTADSRLAFVTLSEGNIEIN